MGRMVGWLGEVQDQLLDFHDGGIESESILEDCINGLADYDERSKEHKESLVQLAAACLYRLDDLDKEEQDSPTEVLRKQLQELSSDLANAVDERNEARHQLALSKGQVEALRKLANEKEDEATKLKQELELLRLVNNQKQPHIYPVAPYPPPYRPIPGVWWDKTWTYTSDNTWEKK